MEARPFALNQVDNVSMHRLHCGAAGKTKLVNSRPLMPLGLADSRHPDGCSNRVKCKGCLLPSFDMNWLEGADCSGNTGKEG